MYFYEIEVYKSFFENGKIIMGHDNCFDNYQLTIIVQEAFDECIEKYCDKLVLDEGEEACRMRVRTIFEKYLSLQLENHGFKNIKIKAKSFIQDGALFADGDECNPVLKSRYMGEILPPCKECERIENDGECVVPNIRKDTSLPTTRVLATLPINLKSKEEGTKDEFNITVLKQYFINFKKSIGKIKIAVFALDDFFDSYDFNNVWVDRDVKVGSGHEGDIFCGFDSDAEKGESKKLLEDYGFILEDVEDGFWITGVKE